MFKNTLLALMLTTLAAPAIAGGMSMPVVLPDVDFPQPLPPVVTQDLRDVRL